MTRNQEDPYHIADTWRSGSINKATTLDFRNLVDGERQREKRENVAGGKLGMEMIGIEGTGTGVDLSTRNNTL